MKFENLIRQLNNENEIELNNFHEQKEKDITQLNGKINELLSLLDTAKFEIQNLDDNLTASTKEIQNLRNIVDQLENEKAELTKNFENLT
jgi:chromosome segregation ATPase